MKYDDDGQHYNIFKCHISCNCSGWNHGQHCNISKCPISCNCSGWNHGQHCNISKWFPDAPRESWVIVLSGLSWSSPDINDYDLIEDDSQCHI